MEQIYDVAVLGGGPGGYTAALYCARAGLSTVVLEKLSPGGQMATTSNVENYPGFAEGVDGFDLAMQMKDGAERFGVETLFADATAVALEGGVKTITTSSGERRARTVILATGADPRPLGVPHEDELRGRGVAYCATCDGMLYRGKTVVVVGGGNSAAEDALFLSRVCKKVYLVHRGAVLTASKSYWTALQKAENVEFIWNSRVVELLYGSVVTGVVLEGVESGNRSELACDGVFIAVGRIPNTGLFHGVLEMDAAGYLIADETTRTALPGVFAVGDVRTKPLRQIITAAADGAVASKYAEAYLAEQARQAAGDAFAPAFYSVRSALQSIHCAVQFGDGVVERLYVHLADLAVQCADGAVYGVHIELRDLLGHSGQIHAFQRRGDAAHAVHRIAQAHHHGCQQHGQ